MACVLFSFAALAWLVTGTRADATVGRLACVVPFAVTLLCAIRSVNARVECDYTSLRLHGLFRTRAYRRTQTIDVIDMRYLGTNALAVQLVPPAKPVVFPLLVQPSSAADRQAMKERLRVWLD